MPWPLPEFYRLPGLAPHLQDRVVGSRPNSLPTGRLPRSVGGWRGSRRDFKIQFRWPIDAARSILSLRTREVCDGPGMSLLLWILRVPAFWRVPGLLKNMGRHRGVVRLEDGTVGAAASRRRRIRASLLNFAFDAQNRAAPLGTTGPHAAPDDAGRSGRPQGRLRPPGPRRPGRTNGRAQRDWLRRWVGIWSLRAGLTERAGVGGLEPEGGPRRRVLLAGSRPRAAGVRSAPGRRRLHAQSAKLGLAGQGDAGGLRGGVLPSHVLERRRRGRVRVA